MRAVYKYPVPIEDVFTLQLPRGAEVLTVDMQHGSPQMWALVDPSQPPEPRRFRFAGTGHPIAQGPLRYVATFQMHGGSLVFHVFEILEAA